MYLARKTSFYIIWFIVSVLIIKNIANPIWDISVIDRGVHIKTDQGQWVRLRNIDYKYVKNLNEVNINTKYIYHILDFGDTTNDYGFCISDFQEISNINNYDIKQLKSHPYSLYEWYINFGNYIIKLWVLGICLFLILSLFPFSKNIFYIILMRYLWWWPVAMVVGLLYLVFLFPFYLIEQCPNYFGK